MGIALGGNRRRSTEARRLACRSDAGDTLPRAHDGYLGDRPIAVVCVAQRRAVEHGARAAGLSLRVIAAPKNRASVHTVTEQVVGGAIGSAGVVPSRLEINTEDPLEMAARTAGPFAPLTTHNLQSVLVPQVHDELRHFPVGAAVQHAADHHHAGHVAV